MDVKWPIRLEGEAGAGIGSQQSPKRIGGENFYRDPRYENPLFCLSAIRCHKKGTTIVSSTECLLIYCIGKGEGLCSK